MNRLQRTLILTILPVLLGWQSFSAHAQSASQQALSTISTTAKNGRDVPNPWSLALDTNVVQGQAEFQDDYVWANALQVGYDLNDWSNVSVALSYDTILSKPGTDGEFLDNYDPHPERYGFGDTNIYYNIPSFGKNQFGAFNFTSALTLPTSQVSQLASMIAAVDLTLEYSYHASSWLILIPSIGTYGREYRYDTTNADGNAVNSPFGLNYGLTSVTRIMKRASFVLGYAQLQRLDYNRDWKMIQSFKAVLSAQVAPHVGVHAGYAWKDYYVTNEAAFAPTSSYALAGMTLSF